MPKEIKCYFCGKTITAEYYAYFNDTLGGSGYYCSKFCYDTNAPIGVKIVKEE